MALPPYATLGERIWHYAFYVICGLIFFFLIFPILVIIPLSFNTVPFFTFTEKMLSLDPEGYSLRWYKDFFTSLNWQGAVRNSFIIAVFSTLIATFLGTLAALGLSRAHAPYRIASSSERGPRVDRPTLRSWSDGTQPGPRR